MARSARLAQSRTCRGYGAVYGAFALAAIFGHASYKHGDVGASAFVLTLIGFGLLTLGGWLGGAIVFVHGMRVLNLLHEPAFRAAAPVPHPEKEMAEGL